MEDLLKNKLKLLSFFSGAGFLDLGFEKSGYEILYVNEYHKPFLEAYKYSREKLKIQEPKYGHHQVDICEILDSKSKGIIKELIKKEHSNSNFVGFIGGPPCPDFSVGGKNRGRHGDKGKLSGTYIDLICRTLPDFFVFENVKGLWKTKKHREFFEELKYKAQSYGYVTTERLISSIEYGVPQDRDRIIFIGFKKNFLLELGKELTEETVTIKNFPWEHDIAFSKENIAQLEWPDITPFYENSDLPLLNKNIPVILTVNHWFEKNDVNNHQNSEDFFQPKALKRFHSISEGDSSRKSFKRLHRWRYSPTAAYGNNEVHLHPYKARRISVAEALAIQSLPRDFVLPENMTLTNKFKTIGNGVPYLASKAIANTIKQYLQGNNVNY
ncbi:DNA cytosine methyltransferase [Geosporobacter ferrireducens]|uniref:DNA (cytosine-5-)-methyltransferase n=1 Tax=Geosporobacter ferrireducens TaxID=1424294 RepID=A0A1D8GLW4_9FIRM|nr:DNA cytosine methyltransferase [Geosporobacter ferrireducens]AOT71903.1 modification methylase NmeDIP [Geosporobacter ferrireducens]MTI55694.1 DNA cytosine methyltransferase [Geosporobacter ferrireducens]